MRKLEKQKIHVLLLATISMVLFGYLLFSEMRSFSYMAILLSFFGASIGIICSYLFFKYWYSRRYSEYSVRKEYRVLRPHNEVQFDEQLKDELGLEQKEISLYREMKTLQIDFGKNNSDLRDNLKGRVDELIELDVRCNESVPLIEQAKLQETIWRLDRSQVEYAEKMSWIYIKLTEYYIYDEDPRTYVNICIRNLNSVLEFLRTYQSDTLTKQLESVVTDLLSDSSLSIDNKIYLVEMCSKYKFLIRSTAFSVCTDEVLKSGIDYDNQYAFTEALYPALIKMKAIDHELVVDKLLEYVDALAADDSKVLLSSRVARELKGYAISNGVTARLNEIQQRISNLTSRGQEIFDQSKITIGQGTISFEVPDFSNMTLMEATEELLSLPMITGAGELPLASRIATLEKHDSDGRLRANDDDTWRFNSISIQVQLSNRAARARCVSQAILEHPEYSSKAIHQMFSLILPESYCKSVADSFVHFLCEEYRVALPVLIPRFESALKKAVPNAAAITDVAGLDQPAGLVNLLNEAIDRGLLLPEEEFEIKLLLFGDERGAMVRHEICHGSLNDDAMSKRECTNAYWLALKLIVKLNSNNNIDD